MDENERRVYQNFEELSITDYEIREHVAITSTEESDRYGLAMEGLNVKNLLLREKKSDRYFLVVIDEHRKMDMNHFKEVAGWKKITFATEEELWSLLQLIPGSVTPLALFNDKDKKITVVLGREIKEAAGEEKISFHPCRNTATVTMNKGNFMKYLEHMGNTVIFEE